MRSKRGQTLDDTVCPWYSAREPLEPYGDPELRSAARRTRRLVRRYWYQIFFETNSPMARSVLKVMERPPERSEPPSIYDQMRQLLDAGKIVIDKKAVDEFMQELRVTK
jgi:hypothetical protein